MNTDIENGWTAIVSHDHGNEVYFGETREDVVEQVASYVAEWYFRDLEDMQVRFDIRKALIDHEYEEACRLYFRNHIREHADVSQYTSGTLKPLVEAQDTEKYHEDLMQELEEFFCNNPEARQDHGLSDDDYGAELSRMNTDELEDLFQEAIL